MKKHLLAILTLLLAATAFAQPANDDCVNAQNLGTLPTPNACGGPPAGNPGIGATLTFTNLTNVAATGPVPYTTLNGCQGGGNQPGPAADVWYQFTATANEVFINISGTLPNPSVTLWTGTCGNLVGRGCANGNATTVAANFDQIVPGQVYYIQVSGATTSQQGTFTLAIHNDNDCNDCLVTSNLTVSPAPVNGTYLPGTAVTFCYTITNWRQSNTNWLHGVVPSFGPGWNLASLTGLVPAASCDLVGTWGWYNSVTSTATSNTYGPGFFYERGVDNNPGNNFGDNCQGTVNWTFCWTITTAQCPPASHLSSLNVVINTLGDGESGSWSNLACTLDPNYQWSASLSCCPLPTVSNVNVPCASSTTGSATAQGQGTGPYNYTWAQGATVLQTNNNTSGSSTINSLPPGTYTVSVTDLNDGCVTTRNVTISAPAAVSVSASSTNIPCNGAANGSATASGSGGTGTINYAWSNGGNTAAITNLAPGTYTVTATDANGCTATSSVTITQPAAMSLSASSTNIPCFGAANGTATASGSGGSGTISYQWSNGGTTATISNLAPGSYTVTATDANGCTRTQTVSVTQAPQLTVSTSGTNIPCFGAANGSATATGAGGTGSISYAWSNGGTTASISNLVPGTYTVTATDGNGCTATNTFTVTQAAQLTVSGVQTNVSCNGAANGTATATGSGGTGGISYAWSNGGNTASISNLPPGTYTVTATDANGCTATSSVTVTQPTAVAVSASSTNIPCFGTANGTATASGSGGTGSISYAWSNGGSTAAITNLAPGTYTVTATDANGCTATNSVTITQGAQLNLSASSTNIPCFGLGNGTATASGSGGTGGLSYNWSNGGTTAAITGLTPGSYTVTLTDASGCTATQTVSVTQPAQLTASIAPIQVNCNGAANGSATASSAGGTGGISFAWSNGGTTATISNLVPGNYTVTATDANGCTATQSVAITQPTAITFTMGATQATCGIANGTASVQSPSGGTGAFSYAWSNGGTTQNISNLVVGSYTVTVTDANGCTSTNSVNVTSLSSMVVAINAPTNVSCNGLANGSATATPSGGAGGYLYSWSNGQTNATATGLAAGTYTVTVTDANLCVSTQQVVITQPAALTVATVNTPAACNAGSTGTATATPSGGTGGVSYAWSNGGSTATISSLPAGSYTVTITDANGCTATQSTTVTQPTAVQVSASMVPVLCNGGSTGSATASGTGGTGSISYAWSNGGSTATISSAPAGSYTVTATDGNGCTATTTISVTEPSVLTAATTTTNASCNGSTNGGATASGSGGTGSYSFSWSNGGSTATLNNLPPGLYTVTVTDQNGCTATSSSTVTQPSAVAVATVPSPVLCNGTPTGSATASGSGGTGAISYTWSNGQTGANAVNLLAGTYTVTGTDVNGCTAIQTVTVTQPPALSASLVASAPVPCFGGSNGTATISATGGVGGYTYAWTNGATTATVTNLAAGAHMVTVTDANGCRSSVAVNITQPAPMTLTAVATPVNCYSPNPDGTAGVTVQGGTQPYTYMWSNGFTGPYQSGLSAGTYSVTVTDDNGCTANISMVVDPPVFPTVVAGPGASYCEGTGGVTISATAGNTTPGYYFVWWCGLIGQPCGIDSVYDNDPQVNPPTSTWFYVQVFDHNGCPSDTDSVYVTVLPRPIVDAGPDQYICGDSAPCVVLNPTITNAPGPFTYQWMPSTGLNNPNIPNPCARPDTTTIYALVVGSGNGCFSDYTTTDTLATVTVHVNPVPVADAGIDHEICFGDSVQLPGVGTGAGPAYEYQWSPGTGLSDSLTSSPLASPPITTTYTLVVWSNGCPSYGDPVTVEVHTLPTVEAGWNREICQGDTILIDATAGGDSTSGYTYVWTPSLPVVGGDDEDALVAPTQTTTFYVQATSDFGCLSALDSTTVYMIPTPIAEAGPNLFYCPGDTTTLQGSYSWGTLEQGEPGTTFHAWSPNQWLSDSTQLQPQAWPGSATFYYLTVWHRTCYHTDSMLVTVGAEVHAQASIDTSLICSGDSVALSAVGSLGSDIMWVPPLGVADPQGLTTMASPDSSVTYFLIVGQGGCYDSIAVPVQVIPSPQADYVNSAPSGCAPHTVHLTQTSSEGVFHIWNFGDGSPVSNMPMVAHTYPDPGTYPITLIAVGEGGCADTAEVLMVTAGALAEAAFSSTPDYPVEMSIPHTEVSFEDESLNAVSWLWDFGDGEVSTDRNPTHQYFEPGNHFVTLTVQSAFGCMSQIVHGPYVIIPTDLFIPNVFSPNGDGLNESWNVEYSGSQPYLMLVYDRWGVKMHETRNKTEGWPGVNLAGEPVPDGVYYYRVIVGNRDFVGNITLMR